MAERATVTCPHCGGSLAVVSGIEAAVIRAVQEASDTHGVSTHEVMSRCRRARFVRARHQVFRLLREDGYSYPEIGEATGYHTSTVQHAIRKSGAPRVFG